MERVVLVCSDIYEYIFYTKIHNPYILSWISLSAARTQMLKEYDFSRIKNYKEFAFLHRD